MDRRNDYGDDSVVESTATQDRRSSTPLTEPRQARSMKNNHLVKKLEIQLVLALLICLLPTCVSGFAPRVHRRVCRHHEQQGLTFGTTNKRLGNDRRRVGLVQESLTLKATKATTTTSKGNSNKLDPSWKEILEIPIPCPTQQDFDSIPVLKRLAIISRVSVLHLTLLSCFGPFVLRGALLLSGGGGGGVFNAPLTLGRAALFTLDGLSWHVVHNLLNDWQDLDDDDDVEDSFRLAYGCHALKQGFVTKRQFLAIMALLSIPGAALTVLFRNTVLAPAALFGIVALFFYTIVFKPLALGEIVIYLVWGPLMAGFGQLAAGAPWQGTAAMLRDPAVALFGLAGFGVIMGKHTDKITRSRKKTLPAVLGMNRALKACQLTLLAPHLLLLWTFWRERIIGGVVPTVPWGAALAFLTLFREFPAAMRIMSMGPIRNNKPNLPRKTVIKGTLLNAEVDRAWPLWFVAFMGWHAITFAYLMVIGSGAEWMGRALFTRFGVL